MPLVSLDHVAIAYGHLPLLADASLQVEPRERVCVIGRNGTGKSTLLRIIGGDLAPEAGSVWHQPGLRIGSLAQDVPLDDPRPVFAVVSEGSAISTEMDDWRKRTARDAHAVAPGPAARRVRAHAVRRMAPPRAAGARARRVSRTCCCSTSRPTISTSRR